MTRASKAAPDQQQRVHVPERTVPGSEPALVEVPSEAPAPAAAAEEVLVLDFGGQYSQLIVHDLGGRVEQAPAGEFGRTKLSVNEHGALLAGTPDEQQCWMSHRDTV